MASCYHIESRILISIFSGNGLPLAKPTLSFPLWDHVPFTCIPRNALESNHYNVCENCTFDMPYLLRLSALTTTSGALVCKLIFDHIVGPLWYCTALFHDSLSCHPGCLYGDLHMANLSFNKFTTKSSSSRWNMPVTYFHNGCSNFTGKVGTKKSVALMRPGDLREIVRELCNHYELLIL